MLTESQTRAIECPDTEIIVTAGAGSGKTTVLTNRVAWLLKNGASASDLLVLTFTRKAAGDMISRLEQRLEEHGIQSKPVMRGLSIGTFHSLAFGILRQDGQQIGYGSNLTVADENDADALMERVAKDLGYLSGSTWRQGLSMKKLRAFREHWYTYGTYESAPGDPRERAAMTTLVNEYRNLLFNMNCVDFGGILLEVQRLWTTCPDVLAKYRARYRHVLVDEVQDANTIQHYGFIDMLCPPATFFGVGDRRQSIYSFRGSRPDLMTERHPNATIIDLPDCFRCADSIIEAANTLIARNNDPLARPMIGRTGRTGRVDVFHGRSEAIALQVQSLHEDGFAWSDIAVIARSHRVLKRLHGVMVEQKVPAHRVGSSFDICETDGFLEIVALLRLLCNPRDNLAFLRAVQIMPWALAHYAMIRREAAECGCSHMTAMTQDDGNVGDGLEQLLIDACKGIPPETIDQALADIGARHKIAPEVAGFLSSHVGAMPIPDGLTWLAMREQQDDVAADGAAVTLLTGHAAKGLEWPCVLIANCNEGDFPSSQSLREDETAAEERRLFYVAMTRAKEALRLHARRPEDQAEGRKISAFSRFIGEAGVVEKSQ